MEIDVRIIAEREKSSMASTWTEYLCIQNGKEKRIRLFTGMYEGLDEALKYYDEDTENYKLPKTIDGKNVVKVDDEVVVGGKLNFIDAKDMVEFDSINDSQLSEWLKHTRWIKLINKSQLSDEILHVINGAN